ncbi:MAG: cytochrome ubiquinol oxidase subunit I [Anaerolineales bacterium]|nr:cytochrome ubiquinol oxidase subunit I [Anaerolineales bacterium]
MDALGIARSQFAITSIYHFFFIPLTMGLSILVAIMETRYVRSGDDVYKKMAKFWGKLFLINFALGVVTGIVMEFQFGMNWSEYSRFVGDIFGVPLAIEALLAFFLESTFLGIWIFGWDKLPKGLHAGAFWAVAIGSNLSALWILMANSWMQHPVGYELVGGKAQLVDFGALVSNSYLWLQFPHVIASALTTAAFFVLAISAYHLLKKDSSIDFFQKSFRIGLAAALIGSVLVVGLGHLQMQMMVRNQPMKVAASEALWESEDPAGLSLVAFIDKGNQQNTFAIRIPYALSLLTFNKPSGEVRGILDLQAEYEALYGPGDYIPPVTLSFWTFRIMVGLGLLMALVAFAVLYLDARKLLTSRPIYLRLLGFTFLMPYLSNTVGWLLTEFGRQPWIVFGLLKVQDGVSPGVSTGAMITSLIAFMLLYGILMIVDVYLLLKFARTGPVEEAPQAEFEPAIL